MNAYDRIQLQQLRVAAFERKLRRAKVLYWASCLVPYFAVLLYGALILANVTPAVWSWSVPAAICMWVIGAPMVAITAAQIGQEVGKRPYQRVLDLEEQVWDEQGTLRYYLYTLP